MKSPPVTGSSGSSGSSTGNRKVGSHPGESGVRNSSSTTKQPSAVGQAVEGEHALEEKKWQAYFDSPRDASADNETVRGPLNDVLKDPRSEKEVKIPFHKDGGKCSGYDVKELMAQIYQDLDDVATAQALNTDSGGALSRGLFLGELNESDLLLREVSVGVTSVISKSLQLHSTSTIAYSSAESALAHLYNPEHPQSSEVWRVDESMARCLHYNDPSYKRYGHLATQHPSWKFLTKLAHSAAFRDAACTLDESTWRAVSASIDENTVSLIVFVETCGLHWWSELIRLNSLFPPPFDFTKYQPLKYKKPSPHKWVVTEKLEDVRWPTFNGKRQINILKNIYRDTAFQNTHRPFCWPADRPYPEDPTIVRDMSITPCITCHSHTPCRCSFLKSPEIYHPLVELRDYGHKGVGIRALERIPRRAILGEYVGEIFPCNYTGDPIYGLDFSLPRRRADDVIATISSKRYGNWTRFMNHSCDPATAFRTATQGGRHRMVVQAVRDIEIFEEVTVDYGDGYWRDRECECGVEGCFSKMRVRDELPKYLSTTIHED